MKKNLTLIAALVLSLGVAACHKKEAKTEEQPASAPVVVQAPAVAATPPAEQSDEERQRARKQGMLDYATMEDKYINDARAQWASSATASTTFGQHDGHVSGGSLQKGAIGPVDGTTWTNDQQNIGFDWLELGFVKAVNATEIRVVFPEYKGVEAVSKVELQDTEGNWHTVWSGVSDVKREERGPRTWFIKTFEKTAYKAKAMKITIANNMQSGYKEVDAVQLVGD